MNRPVFDGVFDGHEPQQFLTIQAAMLWVEDIEPPTGTISFEGEAIIQVHRRRRGSSVRVLSWSSGMRLPAGMRWAFPPSAGSCRGCAMVARSST